MGGFRKTGVFPPNPGAIDDKMLSLAVTVAFTQLKPESEVSRSVPSSASIESSQEVYIYT